MTATRKTWDLGTKIHLSTTPEHLRFDPAEYNRKIEQQRSGGGDALSNREFVRPASLSGKAKRAAMSDLVQLQAYNSGVSPGLEGQEPPLISQRSLDELLAGIPDLPNRNHPLGRDQDRSFHRTPERQAQIEQARMWAGCGILPPHVRKKFPVSIAAVLARISDIAKTNTRKCCDWGKARLAKSVGVCTRTVQRAFAAIERGQVPGLSIKRPINCGPATDTNVVTFTGEQAGKRLRKLALDNRWGARLFDLPKERLGYIRDAIAPETERRDYDSYALNTS